MISKANTQIFNALDNRTHTYTDTDNRFKNALYFNDIIYEDGEHGEDVIISIDCDYGVVELFEYSLASDNSGEYYYVSRLNSARAPVDGILTLPAEYNNIPVKKIGALFTPIDVCVNVTKIIVPSSYTYIGEYCFSEWPELKTVEFCGEGNLSLDMRAFSGCPKLENVIIPSGKQVSFGEGCFRESGLKSLTVHKGSFCANVVWGCENLEKLSFGADVYEILNTQNLGSGNLKVKYLEVDENNKTYKCVDNCILDMSDNLIFTCQNSVLPDYIKGYIAGAFTGLNPERLIIPSGVTMIEMATFAGCDNLKYLELPENAIIGWYHELNSLTNLKTLVLNNPTPMTIASQNALPSGLEAIYVPDGSVDTYKNAENWAAFKEIIQPISEIKNS
jgi:hypothetical protein